MNDLQQANHQAQKIAQPDDSFKGYTLEELRYQRGLALLHREFCKTRILKSVQKLQDSSPFSPNYSAKSLSGKAGFLAGKLLNGLNYLDYAMIGFSVFGTMRKVFSFFKGRKRK